MTALVAMVRCGLWVLPLDRLRKLVAITPPSDDAIAGTPTNELVWAVKASSRRIPGATCLTQALTLHKLLRAAGHSSKIEIGVAKSTERGFQAHAWVESEGQTLLSSPLEASAYRRLLTLGNDPARN